MSKVNMEFSAASIVAAATQDILLPDGKPAFDLDEVQGARRLFDYFAKKSAKTSKTFPRDVRDRLSSHLEIAELSPLVEVIEGYVRRNKDIISTEDQREHITANMVDTNLPDVISAEMPSGYAESLFDGGSDQSQPALAAE